jgi:hypothetical protein
MTYADTYKRRSELRSKLGEQRIEDIMAEAIRTRRIWASVRHMAHRVNLARMTAYGSLK